LPATVERERADGSFERVAVRRLRPGDRVRVLPGETLPADGEIEEGASRFDEAVLTGESEAVRRAKGECVVAGSHNVESPVVVRVTHCGADTRFAEIVSLMEIASAAKPRAAQLADMIASPFLVAVIVASAAAGAWWWSAGPAHAIGIAIAVLIVTCPCALSLATPAATLAAAGALARQGIFVRRLQAIEDCAAVDTIVFDKTGTLTQADLSVAAIHPRAGHDAPAVLAQAAALARDSLHPAARAIFAAARDHALPDMTNVREVAGQGIEGDAGAAHWRLGSASFCRAPAMPSAARCVHLADADGWLAAFELEETLRPDAARAVQSLRAQHLSVQLLSGDQHGAVERLAARVGIDDALGEQTPESKLARIAQLQSKGRRVLMAGDGLNDGPVLARADVSVAMGRAVPLAQARSDFIVPGGQLASVPRIVQLARRTRAVVRENLAWAALYNAVCVPLAVIGWMPPWLAGLGMAASSLFVVANAARLAREAKET
jgi:Cu2+-exporting ATPase